MKHVHDVNATLNEPGGNFASTVLELLPAGVFVLTIDVPGKVNLLKKAVLEELDRRIDQIDALCNSGTDLGAGLIIRSSKSGNFIAGADVQEIDAIQNLSIVEAYEAAEYGKKVLSRLGMRGIKIPTVAAIHGACQGGGMELALWCDYRIATNDPLTQLGLPEVRLGVLPGFGGCVLLPQVMGDVLAAVEFATRAVPVGAQEALQKGLVNEVVDAESLLTRATEVLMTGEWNMSHQLDLDEAEPEKSSLLGSLRSLSGAKLSEKLKDAGTFVLRNYAGKAGRKQFAAGVVAEVKKKSKGYIAPAKAVDVIMRSIEIPFEAALKYESAVFAELCLSQESRNMVDVFHDKSRAKKIPEAIIAGTVNKIGVVGAGVMGREIAFEAICSEAFSQVVLVDIFQKSLESALIEIATLVDSRIKEGKLKAEEKTNLLGKLTTSVEYSALAVCDAVIEAVRETVEDKVNCYRQIDTVMATGEDGKEKTYWIFSNTSALSLSLLSQSVKYPDRFAGLHFFNPVSKMALVEVGSQTGCAPEAVATGMDIAAKLGKLPIPCTDSPGFIVNRILAPYILITSWLLAKGVSPHLIDKAMLDLGMPMGPATLLDQVGLDIVASVSDSMFQAYGERMSRPAQAVDAIDWLKAKGQLGKKSGAGIYLWENGSTVRDPQTRLPRINPQLAEAFAGFGKTNMATESIQEYLVLSIVNEAIRAMEDNVASEPYLIDLAFIFATGFPASLGGPLRLADQRGVRTMFELSQDIQLGGTPNDSWRANYEPAGLFHAHSRSRDNFYPVR
ncbi:MAG: enoyl-CoA hydratase/isomerase family protein [Candidatus Melainabacteria bacterium]|nr:enoyl-CoA hydratase/isomerase family protein [Candidatus Melainabacteria bacterium]